MTLKECIDLVDAVKPNQYTIEDKVHWLSFLDHTIINDVLKTHEGYDSKYDEFTGYSPDRLSDSLIVPSPYDRMYTAYLKMKIDEENGETARYNNSAAMYNTYLLEFKRYYNKYHMPLHSGDLRRIPAPIKPTAFVSDVQLEYIKREILDQLRDDVSAAISKDKVYDVIMEYVAIHRDEFKGKDGSDGKDGVDGRDGADGKNGLDGRNGLDGKDGADGRDGINGRDGRDGIDGKNGVDGRDGVDGKNGASGRSAYSYALSAGYNGTEAEFAEMLARGGSGSGGQAARIGDVTLYANNWSGTGPLYSQVVTIAGVTENSQVDLTPSVQQLAVFYEKDLTFVTENDGGVVTVYAIGQKPENDYTIQVTITEVTYG